MPHPFGLILYWKQAPALGSPCIGKDWLCTQRHRRHSMAMQLLQACVDRAIIALWLGHESVETAPIYLDVNSTLNEQHLARTISPEGHPAPFMASRAPL